MAQVRHVELVEGNRVEVVEIEGGEFPRFEEVHQERRFARRGPIANEFRLVFGQSHADRHRVVNALLGVTPKAVTVVHPL